MIPALFALMLQAAPAPTVCPAIVAPPIGFAAWPVVSAITKGPINIGQATGLMLQPAGTVTFALAPSREPKQGSFGGIYTFNVAKADTYRIALEDSAWIDLVRDGKAIESVAHMHGPNCSGIRKIVDFALTPGRYTLQLSGASKAPMRVLIVPK